MIKSLEIQNFQSHKHSKLEFADGVNVIIGLSDSGKSSIMRALRWLIRNRPSGDAFRSTWGGVTSVEIITNNNSVVRWKEKTESGYGLDEQEFFAFKTEVPEEIRKVLNINEINLQQQLDAPFLLSNSPGEVAQHFNRIAHLDQIDKGSQTINSWINEFISIIGKEAVKDKPATGLIKQLNEAEENLLAFAHLDMFEKDIEVLETMQDQLIIKINNNHKLIKLIQDLQDVTRQIEEESKIIKAEELLINVLKCIEDRKIKQHEQYKLIHLIKEIEELNNEIIEQENILPAEELILELLDLFTQQKNTKVVKIELQTLMKYIYNTETELKLAEIRLEKLQQEFIEIFPNICPLCRQKVKKL